MKSKGFGDTVEKFTKATRIKKAVDTISEITGKDCGCSGRKAALNSPKLLINKTFYKI